MPRKEFIKALLINVFLQRHQKMKAELAARFQVRFKNNNNNKKPT